MNIIEVQSNHEMFSKEFQAEAGSFIYDKFGIVFKKENEVDVGVCVYYEKGIWGTQIGLIALNNSLINEEVFYVIQKGENNRDGIDVLCNTNDRNYVIFGHDLAVMVLRVICYIMATPRDRVVKKKGNPKPKSDSQKKSTKQYENKVFLLDEIVEYVNENGLNQIKRTGNSIKCPCWTVRGHFRHYKSGKVIFVENYKKGKERANAEPKDKTYII